MSPFGRRAQERRERSAEERERARLERERRRAAREGRPLPPEPEPAQPPPPAEPPPAAATTPPAAPEPPAAEPPPAPAPEPPAPEPPPRAPEPEAERPAERAPAPPPDPIEHAAGLPLSIDPEFDVPRFPSRTREMPPDPPAARQAGSWFDEDEERTQVRTAPSEPQPPAPAPAPPADGGRREGTGELPAVAPERPLGTRRVRAPSVNELPRVADAPPRPVPGRTAPKRRRGTRRIAGLAALALIAAAAWFAISLWQPFTGDDQGEGRVRVTVPQGATVGEIGDLLAERDVVGSSFFFSLRARLAGTNLKSGTFQLRRNMSYAAALETLERTPAPPPVVRITIPEGRSRGEVAPLVRQAGLRGGYMNATRRTTRLSLRRLGAPRGTDTLEGLLYPATYELKPGSSVRRLVALQLEAFERALDQVDLRAARRRNLTTYDVVIIASMIEREASVARDRRLISAVIHNRLRQHMPLGIDATIRYRLNQWTRPLRVSELETDSAFNTRKRQGLPPTPIGNPGLPSLRAAARPANVDYVYYVVKPCGNGAHAFSSTDAEFQRDVAAYNRARERRGGRDPSRC